MTTCSYVIALSGPNGKFDTDVEALFAKQEDIDKAKSKLQSFCYDPTNGESSEGDIVRYFDLCGTTDSLSGKVAR